MVHLGMLDAGQLPIPAVEPSTVVRGDGNTDEGITSPAAGYFVSATEVGEHLTSGDRIGAVLDENGRERAIIAAPAGGIVMLLRRGARVQPGDTLAILGADVTEPDGADADTLTAPVTGAAGPGSAASAADRQPDRKGNRR
jgi:predicted deacylase